MFHNQLVFLYILFLCPIVYGISLLSFGLLFPKVLLFALMCLAFGSLSILSGFIGFYGLFFRDASALRTSQALLVGHSVYFFIMTTTLVLILLEDSFLILQHHPPAILFYLKDHKPLAWFLVVFFYLVSILSLVESCDLNIMIKKIEAETYVKQTHRWKTHHFFERLSCFGNLSPKSKISEQSRLLDTKSCDDLIDTSDHKDDIEKN